MQTPVKFACGRWPVVEGNSPVYSAQNLNYGDLVV